MRRFCVFVAFAEQQLNQPWFWIFLIVTALIGPAFVVLHSETDRATREKRPILSESATVHHFDTATYSRMAFQGEPAALMFRTPSLGSGSEVQISTAFSPGWALVPLSSRMRSGLPTWSSPINGSLSDFHLHLFSLLMLAVGVLAMPSRRRLALLRRVLPTGRGGTFLMVSAVLALKVALLAAVSCAATEVTLMLTQHATSNMVVGTAEYFAAVLVYGMGFALAGLALAALVRRRAGALGIALAILFAVVPWVRVTQSHLAAGLSRWLPQIAGSQFLVSPLGWIVSWAVVPSRETFYFLSQLIVRVPEALRELSPLTLMSLWLRLGLMVVFWFVISWILFPKTDRQTS